MRRCRRSTVADIGERLYVVEPAHTIYPDVVVHEQPDVTAQPAPTQRVAASLAVDSDPAWVLTIEPVEMREVFVHIVSVADASRVITAIEVLSPSSESQWQSRARHYIRVNSASCSRVRPT